MKKALPLIFFFLFSGSMCQTVSLPEDEPFYVELKGWGIKKIGRSFVVGKYSLKIIRLPIESCGIVILAKNPAEWEELLKLLGNVCLIGEN